MGEMTVQRITDGLWRWTAPHPEWTPVSEDWDRIVGAVYAETPEAVVLIDPLVPADDGDAERFWRALDQDVERLGLQVVVALTCRWHVRSSRAVVERYSAEVFGPADTGEGLSGLVTRVVGDGEAVPGLRAVRLGSKPPNEECAYLLTAYGTLVVGDVLQGSDDGLRFSPPSWYATDDREREWYRTGLTARLAELPDEQITTVLCGHGPPVSSPVGGSIARAIARRP